MHGTIPMEWNKKGKKTTSQKKEEETKRKSIDSKDNTKITSRLKAKSVRFLRFLLVLGNKKEKTQVTYRRKKNEVGYGNYPSPHQMNI